MPENDLLQRLVDSPQERMDTELKPWLSLDDNAHIAKIVKGCLAMRNNGGGYLILGFDDNGKQASNAPADPRLKYPIDIVQGFVTKYASDPFAIEIEFRSVQGIDHPIIVIPRGVITPVASRSSLKAEESTKPLIEDHDIYVRTISSNNTVSSSKLRKQDLGRLMSVCFENREADIGAFIRRHLVGVDFLAILGQMQSTSLPNKDRSIGYLNESLDRLKSVFADRMLSFPQFGFLEAAVVFDVKGEPKIANQDTLFRMMANRKRYSGWPPFTVVYNHELKEMNPYHFNGNWEALMHSPEPADFSGMIDFWRADPKGKLYYYRVFEEDLGYQSLPSLEYLDFGLTTIRLTEVIASVLELCQLFAETQTTTIELAVRWTGLKDRELGTWTRYGSPLRGDPSSKQDSVATTLSFPSDLGVSTIPVLVNDAAKPLFLAFDGTEFEREFIEEIATNVLNGRR